MTQLRTRRGGIRSALRAFATTVFSCTPSPPRSWALEPTPDSRSRGQQGRQAGWTGPASQLPAPPAPSALPRRPRRPRHRAEHHGPQLLGTRRGTCVKLTESAQGKGEASLQRGRVPLVPGPGPGPPPPPSSLRGFCASRSARVHSFSP